jgi:hypothetical protein
VSVLLYDSDNPDSIPDGVHAAGYCDGYAALAWNARGWVRFPNALRIAVSAASNDGHALDVENGDALPWQAPGWVRMRRTAGVPLPWVYVNRSNRPSVEFELNKAGILSTEVALWVATLDGTINVPAGPYPVAAVQYADSAMTGGHYDLSTVNELYGPGRGTLGGDEVLDPTDPIVVELLTGLRNVSNALFAGAGSPNPANPYSEQLDAKIKALAGGSGGTEPPEPAEPKTVTLHIPAQDIKGDLA